jgi:hypothetical protein
VNDSRQRPATQNRILLLLVALTLIRGLIYASVTPPWWQGHDEDFHFTQTRLLVNQWSMTSSSEEQNWPREMVATFVAFPLWQWFPQSEQQVDLVNIPDRYTYFSRNSLSYYLYAWLGVFLIHQDLLFQLLTLRLVSVLIACGSIIFAFLSAKQVFPGSLPTQILVPWLIIFNPSFMVIATAINDGNLAVLLSTIIFYLLLKLITEYNGWRPALLALGLTVLAFWSKLTTLFLLFVWGPLLIAFVWRLGRNYWLWARITGGLLAVALLLFITFFHSRLTTYLFLLSDVKSEAIASTLSLKYFSDTFASFWIILGHFVYRLDQIWYAILFLFSSMAVIGLFVYIWHCIKRKKSLVGTEQKSLLLALLFVGASMAVLIGGNILIYSRDLEGGLPLGRYLFPAIAPLSILMVAGWKTLLPAVWRDAGFLTIAVLLFLFDTMVWLNYAIPWYYPFWPN